MDEPATYRTVPEVGRGGANDDPPAPMTPQPTPVKLDDSKATANYANFCRLTGMPEELLIDFGLNSQPMAIPNEPIVVTRRVVTGWHTAKRLLLVLQSVVQRHEAAFGALETDVQKRARRV